MKIEGGINSDGNKTEIIAAKLNRLLANYSIFYQNARGFQWHIRGGKSQELRDKFRELYGNLQEKLDAIAEHIIVLGHQPENIFSEYIGLSVIPESKKIWDEDEAIANILESYSVIITMQKEIVSKAIEFKDDATTALLSDFIQRQEEQMQVYSDFLKKR